MPLELQTVPRVPVLRTGHFDLESGPVDFTLDHLAAAAEALNNDPAVLPLRVRLELPAQGHLGSAEMAVEASGGIGGPSVGWGDNYVVAGNTLYADLHVPAIVAESMEWAFPGRSIEGLFGYTTATGNTHDFMATGLLLLGQSWPGVTTLPDFHEVQAEFATAIADGEVTLLSYAAAELGRPVPGSGATQALEAAVPVAALGATGRAPKAARELMAAASISVPDLHRRWYGAEEAGELDGLPDTYDFWSWYVTEVRADEDGTLFVLVIDEGTGAFWRFDVSAINGNSVTFAAPTEVMLEVVPVSARAGRAPRPALARWGTRSDSRAATASLSPTPPEEPMNDALRRALAAQHQLNPETATEDEILAAVTASSTPEGDDPTPTPPEGAPEGAGAPEGEPVGAAARERTISAGRLEALEADAAAGRAANARQLHGDRDRLVTAALADGRITPAEAGLGPVDPSTGLHTIADAGWRRDLEDAPEVTARALGRLEPGKYPGAGARRGSTPQEGQNSGSADRVRASIRARRRGQEGVKS